MILFMGRLKKALFPLNLCIYLKTSRGCTIEEFKLPTLATVIEVILLELLNFPLIISNKIFKYISRIFWA